MGENYVDITKEPRVTCVEWFHKTLTVVRVL